MSTYCMLEEGATRDWKLNSVLSEACLKIVFLHCFLKFNKAADFWRMHT